MIIDRLAKLDQPKRILAAVLAVLAVAGICYYAIMGDSVVTVVILQAIKAKYTRIQDVIYPSTKNQLIDFSNLQRQLEDRKKQVKEQEWKYFTSEQALQFFENISARALAHNLKPISSTISEPKKLVVDEKAEPQQQFLETQSAKIIVAGRYSDIVNFVNELTGRPQKVYITNPHIALPPGEEFNPRASFSISVLISVFSALSRKVNKSSTNEVAGVTISAGSEIDRQIPVSYPMMLRDPMQFGPATATQGETGKLIVKGIVYNEDNPSAVIGTQIVHEGDKVLGATVVKINKDSVEFEMNDKRWTQKVQH